MYGMMLSKMSIPGTPGEKPAPEMACKVVVVKAVDRTELLDQRLQWGDEAGGGTVGDTDDETWSWLTLGLGGLQLLGNNVQMFRVDDGDDQWHVLFSSVVLGVGNDGDAGFHEFLFDGTSVVGVQPRKDDVTVFEEFGFTFGNDDIVGGLW